MKKKLKFLIIGILFIIYISLLSWGISAEIKYNDINKEYEITLKDKKEIQKQNSECVELSSKKDEQIELLQQEKEEQQKTIDSLEAEKSKLEQEVEELKKK